ncbi:aldolase catalytic domain-containing protein [Neptuniibacter sp. 2_MG-2023]|uniref:aldolase catalytic domain-containing protein n=1 Tax=Neptuniibacter sp. 2_MG-2023 TaxID=3062671 RepID=UPI0026E491C0|nr:aldolase catalytic domain-containing protein [Neptuniibacter sp. 2_MG-2023]MDO6515543.1 aldolase catalytic domain-containing protein [Neptuniibacter sp. 2_MG-2023]
MTLKNEVKILDCTFRDGGYYTNWDFSPDLITKYLDAMKNANVDVVELGFRFKGNDGFKGACAYTTDDFLRTLNIPTNITIGVMLNASDILVDGVLCERVLQKLVPEFARDTPLGLVRIACHIHEFEPVLFAANRLKEQGYCVGFNLMQVADKSTEELEELSFQAADFPIDVLYFADSLGSMQVNDVSRVMNALRVGWKGPIGMHTHNNQGLAMSNALKSIAEGATWVDSTITGMGRGPGNALTEEMVVEIDAILGRTSNVLPLFSLISNVFKPMKEQKGWGTGLYYYLSGKYGIHPTYIQEMLRDARYDDADILAVIEYLRENGAKSFSENMLNIASRFYKGEPRGTWCPVSLLEGREVLILGGGPSVCHHREAIESYIRRQKPVVLALNTKTDIDSRLIDLRVASHPVRMLSDVERHLKQSQPLITPASMLPENILASYAGKVLLDFGVGIESNTFKFYGQYCITPSSLVMSYALAVASSGKAKSIILTGFDGYPYGDARNDEIDMVLRCFRMAKPKQTFIFATPTIHRDIVVKSIYSL